METIRTRWGDLPSVTWYSAGVASKYEQAPEERIVADSVAATAAKCRELLDFVIELSSGAQ
jgi:hypothetical protein